MLPKVRRKLKRYGGLWGTIEKFGCTLLPLPKSCTVEVYTHLPGTQPTVQLDWKTCQKLLQDEEAL